MQAENRFILGLPFANDETCQYINTDGNNSKPENPLIIDRLWMEKLGYIFQNHKNRSCHENHSCYHGTQKAKTLVAQGIVAIFFTIGNTLQKSWNPNSDRITQIMDRIRKYRTGPKNSSCNKFNNSIA